MQTHQEKTPIRIYYEDTDAGGIVYNANYVRYAERGRTEWLRSLGIESRKMALEHDLFFVVASIEIDFKAPAFLDDELIVHSRVETLKKASMIFNQQIFRGEQLLTTLKVKIAVVDKNYKPCRLPKEIYNKMDPSN